MERKGKLFFFCGKMGAGKSTLSKEIAKQNNAVCISEDEWLAEHYPEQIQIFNDYLKLSRTIKPFIKSHVQNILSTGTNVVMDFPANTINQRSWFKSLCADITCEHQMFYLDLTDEQCLAHIALRRTQQPERSHFDTEKVFHHVTQYFEIPTNAEELNIKSVKRTHEPTNGE